MQIYSVLQDDAKLYQLNYLIKKYGIKKWLYLGEDSTWRVKAEFHFQNKIERISIADILNEVSWENREKFIEFIGKNSMLNNSFEWWSSEIAAKNPYTMLYERICLATSFDKFVCKNTVDNMLVICSTRALKGTIEQICYKHGVNLKKIRNINIQRSGLTISKLLKKKCLNLIEAFPFSVPILANIKITQKIIEKNHIHRQKVIDNFYQNDNDNSSETSIILFVTWIDRRSINDKNEYTDLYFKNLPVLLKKQGKNVVFLPQILHNISFEDAVKMLNDTDEKFIFPDLYLNTSDIKESKKISRRFLPIITESDTFFEISIKDLIDEFIKENRYAHSKNLIFKQLIRNMAENGIKPAQIIYPCEGHGWEHALCWAVLKYMPYTKILAYENGTFSRMVLSMYPHNEEFKIMPLPHKLITNGPLFRDILLNEGYPEKMLESGCAFRYEDIWKNNEPLHSAKWNSAKEKLTIVVATSIGLGDTIELISKSIEAFGRNKKYNLLIKCHPLVDQNRVKKIIGDEFLAESIQFNDNPIGDLLENAHVLLYTYTAVCFEAISLGVIPVFVRSENFLNMDKLDIAPDIRYVATSAKDLREVAEKIENITDEEYKKWLSNCTSILKKALSPVNERCIEHFIATNNNYTLDK